MRPTLLLLALALVACDAKDTKPDAAKTAADDETPAAKAAEKDGPSDAAAETPEVAAGPGMVHEHTVKMLDGSERSLADYQGKALLVVNTASECGYTPQYAGLQEVYGKYKDKGLEVLAFPSNDFGGQEPGTNEQIREFVDSKFSVEFDMFDKVVTKGEGQSPLYQTLTEKTGEGIKGEVKWNFTKFLVDTQGNVIARFEPNVDPMDPSVISAIEAALPKA